ncbi:uncharacterized protein MONOS_16646 [Monocercomonoides exilis]|uniref:uncharacterized protein n=1 Tax=Monocercomonoides exilis TaxID=2049356 RepID=UPI003559EC06|nr:hypothetical protein MONOS_16646 [Monocercomonoides exilis]
MDACSVPFSRLCLRSCEGSSHPFVIRSRELNSLWKQNSMQKEGQTSFMDKPKAQLFLHDYSVFENRNELPAHSLSKDPLFVEASEQSVKQGNEQQEAKEAHPVSKTDGQLEKNAVGCVVAEEVKVEKKLSFAVREAELAAELRAGLGGRQAGHQPAGQDAKENDNKDDDENESAHSLDVLLVSNIRGWVPAGSRQDGRWFRSELLEKARRVWKEEEDGKEEGKEEWSMEELKECLEKGDALGLDGETKMALWMEVAERRNMRKHRKEGRREKQPSGWEFSTSAGALYGSGMDGASSREGSEMGSGHCAASVGSKMANLPLVKGSACSFEPSVSAHPERQMRVPTSIHSSDEGGQKVLLHAPSVALLSDEKGCPEFSQACEVFMPCEGGCPSASAPLDEGDGKAAEDEEPAITSFCVHFRLLAEWKAQKRGAHHGSPQHVQRWGEGCRGEKREEVREGMAVRVQRLFKRTPLLVRFMAPFDKIVQPRQFARQNKHPIRPVLNIPLRIGAVRHLGTFG